MIEAVPSTTFHPNVLQNAFRSADVVIGAMRYINARHRYIIAEDMIRIMKRGALVIDLRINQGGCFETTCCLCPSDPAVFEQYGVLHYCRQNISNRGRHRCGAGDDQERPGVQERSLHVLREAR